MLWVHWCLLERVGHLQSAGQSWRIFCGMGERLRRLIKAGRGLVPLRMVGGACVDVLVRGMRLQDSGGFSGGFRRAAESCSVGDC